ncbi:hypothetical protein DFH06DRAFT_1139879 [Mycena polygramma]|nr:hypothetical protein DFH06DRAFT_1139879 [Mycena polygramma]
MTVNEKHLCTVRSAPSAVRSEVCGTDSDIARSDWWESDTRFSVHSCPQYRPSLEEQNIVGMGRRAVFRRPEFIPQYDNSRDLQGGLPINAHCSRDALRRKKKIGERFTDFVHCSRPAQGERVEGRASQQTCRKEFRATQADNLSYTPPKQASDQPQHRCSARVLPTESLRCRALRPRRVGAGAGPLKKSCGTTDYRREGKRGAARAGNVVKPLRAWVKEVEASTLGRRCVVIASGKIREGKLTRD